MDADRLAQRMSQEHDLHNRHLTRGVEYTPMLPYARALIEAERALTAIEDVRTPNDATAADHLRAPALAALRAVIGEP